jgi:hypothetical protein
LRNTPKDGASSYFSLGQVKDASRDKPAGQMRDHWLWTTVSTRYSAYQFDSLRVFIFNPYRHRYETAYIERNMKATIQYSCTNPPPPARCPAFTVLAEDKEGALRSRTYEFQGFRIPDCLGANRTTGRAKRWAFRSSRKKRQQTGADAGDMGKHEEADAALDAVRLRTSSAKYFACSRVPFTLLAAPSGWRIRPTSSNGAKAVVAVRTNYQAPMWIAAATVPNE